MKIYIETQDSHGSTLAYAIKNPYGMKGFCVGINWPIGKVLYVTNGKRCGKHDSVFSIGEGLV